MTRRLNGEEREEHEEVVSAQGFGYAKRVAKFITVLGGAILALAGFPAAFRALGLPMLATETHVEQRIAPLTNAITGLRREVTDVGREAALTRRSQIDNELFKWTIQERTEVDETLKALIRQRIEELREERTTVSRRLGQLYIPEAVKPQTVP